MAEQTLSLQFSDFESQIARSLGYNPDSLTAAQTAIVDTHIQGGYRWFLYNIRGYQWSFMQIQQSIATFTDLAVSASRTISTATVYTGEGVTKMTANSATNYLPMRGRSMTITGSGTYTIINLSETGNEPSSTFYILGEVSGISSATYSISSGGDFRLKDSFGGMRGPLTYAASDNAWVEIPVVGEVQIRQHRQNSSVSTGEPRLAAIAPDGFGYSATGTDPSLTWRTAGQRFKLMLWPTPDAAYTLTYRDAQLRDKLNSTTNKYPLGGATHAETILAAMLAHAEARTDDERGPRWAEYVEKLDQSIRLDRNQFGAERLGYNGNGLMGNYGRDYWRRDNYAATVTVNGVTPE